jgi:hypothetical protein
VILPEPKHDPFTEKQPPVRLMPDAKVEVALVPVTFKRLAATPPVKVDVAVVVAVM